VNDDDSRRSAELVPRVLLVEGLSNPRPGGSGRAPPFFGEAAAGPKRFRTGAVVPTFPPFRVAATTTGPQQLEVLRYLLERLFERGSEGASAPCCNGRLLLHDAVEAGASSDALQFLLKRYPQAVDVEDNAGKLPLHLIGLKTTIEAVTVLVEASASSISARDQSRRLPLHVAVVNGAPLDVLEFLVDKYDAALNLADSNGYLPIHHAVKQKPVECDLATQVQSFACVKYFVEKYPVGLHMTDVEGRLPVHIAVGRRWPYVPTVKYLVKKFPVSLQTPDHAGSLPLHATVAHAAAMEVIRFLHKEHPGAINAATRRGKLPLHIAVAAKYAPSVELTRFLIEESPQAVKARDAKGRLPVHVAFEKEKGFSVACEKEKGFSVSIALHVVKQWPEAVREPHSDGRFPLHKALSQEDQSFELVQLVLQW
jgi:ankyrin repeat protein